MVTQIDLKSQSAGTTRSLNMKPLQDSPEAASTLKLSLAHSSQLSQIADLADRVKTVGYSRESVEIEQLMQSDPSTILVDIRISPRSNNPEWNKGAFHKKYGERYVWVKALGNIHYNWRLIHPEEPATIEIADPETGIAQLLDLLQSGHKLLLMCGCAEYHQCHRKTVYELLQAQLQHTAPPPNAHTNASMDIATNGTNSGQKAAEEISRQDTSHAQNSNLLPSIDIATNSAETGQKSSEDAAGVGAPQLQLTIIGCSTDGPLEPMAGGSDEIATNRHQLQLGGVATNGHQLQSEETSTKGHWQQSGEIDASSEDTVLHIISGWNETARNTVAWILEQYHLANDYAQRCEQEKREIEEEKDQIIADQASELASLKETLTIQIKKNDDLIERCHRYEDKEQQRWLEEKHREAVIQHQDLSGNEKIVGLVLLDEIRQKQADPHEETVVVMEQVAQKTGVSPSTVCRVNKTMNQLNGWEYKLGEKIETESGDYYTPVSIRMLNFLDDPMKIRKEKTPGGPRVKGDRFALTYARETDQVHLDALPGTAADADINKAIKAIIEGRYLISEQLHRFANSNLQESEKQDAFAQFVAQIPNQVDRSEKQDAFANDKQQLAQAQQILTTLGLDKHSFQKSMNNGEILHKMQEILDNPSKSEKELTWLRKGLVRILASEKQDAFHGPVAPQPITQTEKHHEIPTAFNMWGPVEGKNMPICQATWELNAEGKPAGFKNGHHEEVVKKVKCGSTDWYYSAAHGRRACRKCDTPLPEEIITA